MEEFDFLESALVSGYLSVEDGLCKVRGLDVVSIDEVLNCFGSVEIEEGSEAERNVSEFVRRCSDLQRLYLEYSPQQLKVIRCSDPQKFAEQVNHFNWQLGFYVKRFYYSPPKMEVERQLFFSNGEHVAYIYYTISESFKEKA